MGNDKRSKGTGGVLGWEASHHRPGLSRVTLVVRHIIIIIIIVIIIIIIIIFIHLSAGAEGPGFKSQSRRCRVTVLGKLLTPIVPLFTKQENW